VGRSVQGNRSVIGEGYNAFAAACKSQGFARRRFHRNTIDVDPGNFGNARSHDIAMRSDTRSFTHNGYVQESDSAATRTHTINRKSEETVGTGAAPLRVAWREMHANVAVGQCAQNCINEGMQYDIGVRMTRDTLGVSNPDAPQHDMIAFAKLMYVKSKTHPNVTQGGKVFGFCTYKIFRGGQFHVANLTLECADGEPCPFGKRSVVCEFFLTSLMCLAMGPQ